MTRRDSEWRMLPPRSVDPTQRKTDWSAHIPPLKIQIQMQVRIEIQVQLQIQIQRGPHPEEDGLVLTYSSSPKYKYKCRYKYKEKYKYSMDPTKGEHFPALLMPSSIPHVMISLIFIPYGVQ